MRWDRFFEDLEDQLDGECEAERAALASEAERVRLARMTLVERLRALTGADAPAIAFHGEDATVFTGRVTAVGPDWVGLDLPGASASVVILPLAAVIAVALGEPELLHSARPDSSGARVRLSERMTLGYLLRDLARRRVSLAVGLRGGAVLTGTIDRALADHVDLAMHDAGRPRRAAEVTGMRMVPLAGLTWVRLDGAAGLP